MRALPALAGGPSRATARPCPAPTPPRVLCGLPHPPSCNPTADSSALPSSWCVRRDHRGQASQCQPSCYGRVLPSKKTDHRGFVARRTSPETAARLTTRNTVSRTSAVAGRTRLPWRRRERQTDGSAAGGHPHFFQAPHCRQQRLAACHPASPDARSREPSPRTTAAGTRRPSRVPGIRKIAHQVFVKAGSGALPAASSPADAGDEREGVSSKKFSWPLTASASSAQPDVRRRCPTRNEEMPLPASGMPPNDG
jgi:hypothetical protein